MTSLRELSQRRNVFFGLIIGGALLLLLAACLWWTKIPTQPERAFWHMLKTSLTTSGVTLQMNESYEGTTASQVIQYEAGNKNVIRALTTLKQGDTTVKTESIGDSKATFTRYTSIDPGKSAGNSADFKKIEGVWAQATTESNQLFAQIVLGAGLPIGAMPVPIASLQPEQREALLKQIKERSVYQVDYTKVAKENKDGKLLYTYPVEIQPILYLTMMKTYAKYIGLTTLKDLDPNEYANTATMQLKLTVDVRAGQLVGVESTTAGFKETFTAYGIAPVVSLPKQSISTEELQNRFTNIQTKQ